MIDLHKPLEPSDNYLGDGVKRWHGATATAAFTGRRGYRRTAFEE
ncbi:hypothetical protein ACH4F6_37060 [Streptomyces sp. NPDC017936]